MAKAGEAETKMVNMLRLKSRLLTLGQIPCLLSSNGKSFPFSFSDLYLGTFQNARKHHRSCKHLQTLNPPVYCIILSCKTNLESHSTLDHIYIRARQEAQVYKSQRPNLPTNLRVCSSSIHYARVGLNPTFNLCPNLNGVHTIFCISGRP
jgi:hypothetical protein